MMSPNSFWAYAVRPTCAFYLGQNRHKWKGEMGRVLLCLSCIWPKYALSRIQLWLLQRIQGTLVRDEKFGGYWGIDVEDFLGNFGKVLSFWKAFQFEKQDLWLKSLTIIIIWHGLHFGDRRSKGKFRKEKDTGSASAEFVSWLHRSEINSDRSIWTLWFSGPNFPFLELVFWGSTCFGLSLCFGSFGSLTIRNGVLGNFGRKNKRKSKTKTIKFWIRNCL